MVLIQEEMCLTVICVRNGIVLIKTPQWFSFCSFRICYYINLDPNTEFQISDGLFVQFLIIFPTFLLRTDVYLVHTHGVILKGYQLSLVVLIWSIWIIYGEFANRGKIHTGPLKVQIKRSKMLRDISTIAKNRSCPSDKIIWWWR